MGMTYTSSCPMGGWGSAQGVSEGEKGVFFRYDTPPFFFWLTAIYLIRGGEGGVFLHKLSDFSFSQKLFFLHPFHPLYPLIASLCNVYQCLTLYFERSENTPFSPPSPPPRHGFKAGRETTWWFFMQPISPPSSSAVPQTAGEAAWGFSLLSSYLCGGKAVPRVVERRWVCELYIVRLVRVAS